MDEVKIVNRKYNLNGLYSNKMKLVSGLFYKLNSIPEPVAGATNMVYIPENDIDTIHGITSNMIENAKKADASFIGGKKRKSTKKTRKNRRRYSRRK